LIHYILSQFRNHISVYHFFSYLYHRVGFSTYQQVEESLQFAQIIFFHPRIRVKNVDSLVELNLKETEDAEGVKNGQQGGEDRAVLMNTLSKKLRRIGYHVQVIPHYRISDFHMTGLAFSAHRNIHKLGLRVV
jgi:hypothetical protein